MKQYKIYLLHVFLQEFAEMSFFVFGSLLFYLKTSSVINTLFFGLTLKATALIVKSVLVRPFLLLVKFVGVTRIMTLSLLVWGLTLISFFFIHVKDTPSLMLFFLVGIIFSIFNSCYWMLSNAFGFKFLGLSNTPGQYSSFWQIIIVLSSASVSAIGLLLHLDHNFLLLLVVMGLMLVASILPLKYMIPPSVQVVSFDDCVKKLSSHGFWANVNPEHDMTTTGVPLIILLTFGSLSKSIWISILVALITVLFVYLAGMTKDNRNNKLAGLAGLALVAGLILYGFARTPLTFILVGVLVGASNSVVDTAREAGLGRELTNGQDAIAGTIAIEFARSFGGFLGELILVISYLITGTLWQPILIVGAITVLPKIFYALKNIAAKTFAEAIL